MKASIFTITGRIAALALAAAAFAAQAQGTLAAPGAETPAAAFKRLDANGDGKLSKEEVASLPAISDGFVALDKDKDGLLSPEEFSAAFSDGK